MRRRRVEQTIELRKAKKDDQLLKRRNIGGGEEPTSPINEKNDSSVSISADEIVQGM